MSFADILKKLFGSKSERDLKAVKPILDKVLAAYERIDRLTVDELREASAALKERVAAAIASDEARIAQIKEEMDKDLPVQEKEKLASEADTLEKNIDDTIEKVLNEILPDAFAIMKSTARRFAENSEIRVKASDFDRKLSSQKDFVSIDGDEAVWKNSWMAGGNTIVWDMVHYDVQLIGGIALHQGKIAEMATGEGKTLVATLPVFLNALAGKGVHVVTVNDYLSKRDSEWMGPLYMFHGLSVDCIDKHQPNSDARKAAYNADITFGTNNEFGFDYLRDNMATSPKDLVQRKHNYAIVDEVDSVLIDDARTPLIISGPIPRGEEQLFELFRPNVEVVVNAQKELCQKLLIEAKKKMASNDPKVVEEGTVQLYRAYKGYPRNKALIKFLSEPGVKAQMLKTEEYFMSENMRHMHEATDELYMVIDEKNNSVELTDKGIEEFIANGPNENDLQKVKEYMQKTYESNKKENGFWVNILHSYYWEKEDDYTGYDELVNNITSSDLQEFAKMFFNQKNRIEISMTSGDTK